MEKKLKELKLMDENDTIQKQVQGDYYSFGQNRGTYYFTEKAIIFFSGMAGSVTAVIPYEDVKEMKKCFVGPFIPTGIKLTVFDQQKGKNKKHKLSILGRKQWISYITEKTGVDLS